VLLLPPLLPCLTGFSPPWTNHDSYLPFNEKEKGFIDAIFDAYHLRHAAMTIRAGSRAD
jgi:hypothetical protein